MVAARPAIEAELKTLKKSPRAAGIKARIDAVETALADAIARQVPPVVRNKRPKIYYATQAGIEPPTFVFFANDGSLIDDTYHRYLENQVRQVVPYIGLPMKFHFRSREKRAAK